MVQGVRVADLFVGGVVAVGGGVIQRIGNAGEIAHGIVTASRGLVQGIGQAGWFVDGVVAVAGRVVQRIRDTGEIAHTIIRVGVSGRDTGGVGQRVARHQAEGVVAVGGDVV